MAKKEEETTGGGGPNTEKLKALQAAMDKIEKNFGKGSIMKLGDDHVEQVDVIPTGSIALNAALPLPRRRKPAGEPRLSMRSTLSTAFMPPSWA